MAFATMAAASTTMRPHSATSSGSSTPSLSSEASTSTWRGSYATSADLSRRTSSASTSGTTIHTTAIHTNMLASSEPTSSSRGSHAQEWWEHVLPPGQLAERLRKAQRSSSASRRRSSNAALANATSSERSAWKRLSGLPTEKSDPTRSESSTATSSRRSFFQGSTATLPQSAFKASCRVHQDRSALHYDDLSQSNSSAQVSSDQLPGGASAGQHSPERRVRYTFPTPLPASTQQHHRSRRHGARHTTSNSPELSSIWLATSSSSTSPPPLPSAFDPSRNASRSTDGRGMRVMSEDGMASTIFASQQSSSWSSSSSAYRLPSSHSATHLNQFNNTNTDSSSSWNSIAADRTRAQFTHRLLPDTPELSSDEANGVTTTQRKREISTTRTTVRSSSNAPSPPTPSPTILRSDFDRPDQPLCPLGSEKTEGSRSTSPSRRDRHVSFEQSTETPRRASVHDYPEPMMTSSQSAFNLGTLPNREYTSPFDTLPPRSNNTRRPRQPVRISGRRTTSFSLPGSRRGSIHGESPFAHSSTPFSSEAHGHHRPSTSIPDAMLLDSLNVAHKQLASAGNLALTLTRQLSASLRPVFHMTLFLSISSITVLSLACFLCASYVLTAWDDVSKRSHKVGQVAGKTKHKFEKALDWGVSMLGPTDISARPTSKPATSTMRESSAQAEANSSNTQAEKESTSAAKAPVSATAHAFLWSARMAWSATSSVAYRVTPPTISKLFEEDKSSKPKAKTSTLPPRPPLSTLLSSILFTLILAIGAGLNSFLASRRAAAGVSVNGGGGVEGYTVPSPGMEYVHLPTESPYLGRRMSTPVATPAWEKGGCFKRRGVPVR
ncbi:uncharacterized protein UBRO_07873 [Ustilago bromivora]|uniref:Uncharacterized protein n=1 Tax=Ustilago bromivora TaxID=307758 RepID=A0A1K0GD15_9BASI|nr:uncharacterized protein UBRO_07873 [Ustilago bromivora]SYW86127.1 uncharacterized protein UBRO2_05847 [Ustilago bromivora]